MFGLEAEFWVAVAFVLLLVIFGYFGIHRTVLTALDHRSGRIKQELDDARRLRDEAASLLADYKARHAAAEREAQDIIDNEAISVLRTESVAAGQQLLNDDTKQCLPADNRTTTYTVGV